ncbi:MAG: sugar ABC transporter permease [Armatimonadetes bacterium]|nr:sugar ABC transporter permease [Armatimonadota bacterium]
MPNPKAQLQTAGWNFVSPALLIMGIFVAIPAIWGILLAFTHYDGMSEARFVGADNFKRLLDDPLIWTTLLNTSIYVVFTLPVGLALGLGIALALHQKWFTGRSFVRGLYFLPNVTSMAAVAFVWEWILNPEYGLANAALRQAGLKGSGWLSEPSLAMPSVAMVSVWHGLGFGVLIYLAGLRAIPEEVHEAARIDGANSWKAFRHVTWPLLTPTTMFLTIMGVIGGFQVFQSVYIMTGGGPLDRTRVYLYYLWQTAFQNLEMGYASAMAVLLFVIVLLLTLAQWRFFNRRMKPWQ